MTRGLVSVGTGGEGTSGIEAIVSGGGIGEGANAGGMMTWEIVWCELCGAIVDDIEAVTSRLAGVGDRVL
jgi:hypothetical protein